VDGQRLLQEAALNLSERLDKAVAEGRNEDMANLLVKLRRCLLD
jgi:hypothetical protein